MKAALFCLSNLSILWIATRWSASLARRRMDFVVGLAALFPVCASLPVLAGGLTGQLYPTAVTVVAVAVALVLSIRYGWRIPWPMGGGGRWSASITTRIAAAAVIAFGSIPLLSLVTEGTGYFIDDFGYHAVAVASWIKHGAFGQIMPQFMAYLPVNAELLSAWFALPYHDDTMVALAGIIWLGLAAISAGGLARLAGCDATASLLTAAAVLASPALIWQTRTFSACDLAGSASLLAAAYFALSSVKTHHRGQAIAAGLLAGLAAGAKATFLPVALLFCLFPLAASMPRRDRFVLAAAMLAATAVFGSVWYLRNWVVTGNPLFPAQVGPFEGPLTHAEQTQIKLSGLIFLVPWSGRLWGNMIYDYLDWPLPLGILALSGYLRSVTLEFRRPAEAAESRTLRRLLLAGGTAQFVLQLFAPFCLGGGFVDGRIEVFSRYVMPWFLFGLASAAPLLDSRSRYCVYGRALAAIGLVSCLPADWTTRFCCLGAIAIGLVFLCWLPAFAWRPFAWASLAGMWPILAVLGPTLRRETNERLVALTPTKSGNSLEKAVFALESLPAGTRLTRFANQSYFIAPIFGRSWQLDPVFTDDNGLPLSPLHQQFRENRRLTFFSAKPHRFPSANQFVENLRAAGISEVFVTKFDTEEWPPQQRLLAESGAATISFSDSNSTIWHLDGGGK